VGKARNLKDRVGTYFNPSNLMPKVQALVQQIAAIEVTVTNSEAEALLLEYNLIKEHKPRFNVVLRDDKSFPYIHLCSDHEFPRLAFYRGPRNLPGRYFGPFPNAGAVRETLQGLQKLFLIRNCRDTFFANRSRPCLQHQIGRCSAPCVGLITAATYAQDVDAAVKVLEGRSEEVNAQLEARMEQAAGELQFERAAQIRDQLAALKRIQAQQIVTAEAERDADVLALVGEPGDYAVSVMLVRGGRNLGTTSYFPRATLAEPEEALASFLLQYYSNQEPPAEVLVSRELSDADSLTQVLSERSGHAVKVRRPVRGISARWIELAEENATQSLRMRDGEVPAPDLLLIDGGAGQVSEVHEVLTALGFGDVMLVGVAKGPDRRPGQERLFIHGAAAPRVLEPHTPALRLIQRVRDEAHRFAITGHRRKRARRYSESVLEAVPGLGPAKRRALLKHFGGLQGVMRAGMAEFAQVAGIGAALARSIYDHLHPGA